MTSHPPRLSTMGLAEARSYSYNDIPRCRTSLLQTRRYSQSPLTPPSLIPPEVMTAYVSRPELDCAPTSYARASAALSKLASSPGSRSRTAQEESQPSMMEKQGEESFENPDMANRDNLPGIDALRYWNGGEKRDGYISFPDFEHLTHSCTSQDQSTDGESSQEGHKPSWTANNEHLSSFFGIAGALQKSPNDCGAHSIQAAICFNYLIFQLWYVKWNPFTYSL